MGSRILSPVPAGVSIPKVKFPQKIKRNGFWKGFRLRQVPLKRVPIKRESKGRKAEVRKYNESAAAFFAEPGNDVCAVCVALREDGENILLQAATERHHVRGRIGRLLNWRPGQKPCCRGHRLWPHQHPTRARKLGLLCEPQDWNVFPGNGSA